MFIIIHKFLPRFFFLCLLNDFGFFFFFFFFFFIYLFIYLFIFFFLLFAEFESISWRGAAQGNILLM
ncbi:hypothetical protein ACMBCN_01360 [Candidatus Liberibacter asiaticus]|nr:hypothetical protein [Candidatus Liberibacter asiaticus]